MKFLFWEIKRVVKVEPDDKPSTLVVTGNTTKEALEKFEKHCADMGQKVIATNLPVFGVFNLTDSTSQSGVIQKK